IKGVPDIAIGILEERTDSGNIPEEAAEPFIQFKSSVCPGVGIESVVGNKIQPAIDFLKGADRGPIPGQGGIPILDFESFEALPKGQLIEYLVPEQPHKARFQLKILGGTMDPHHPVPELHPPVPGPKNGESR